MTWWSWLGLALSSLAIAAFGLRAYGSRRWAASIHALIRGLEAARSDDALRPVLATRFDSSELRGLPAPVQRYFRAVLADGQPFVSAVAIEMRGTFNMAATGEHWRPFTSRQRIVARRPGFLWDARISMAPGVMVRVVDSYVAGCGMLHAAVLGLYTVAKIRGGGQIARGEFMRFAAEAAWYPTALLPSQGVRWEAVDENSANATFTDHPLTLTLLFRFGDSGLIDSVRAEARGGLVGSTMIMMPWECSLSGYQPCGGILVPLHGEAAWMRPEGRRPYFRGTITSLSYELAR
jgi:hypothetical protein